ncbi:hypothetical protein [Rubellimicrobium aerolatum]|uniref:Acyltransferase n=1 Tax=Rubellimicrobium aerolatum TaxID=490979 RepID=A0ABW0SBD5_9RHOB|nr:hypothetical protein [Rubellimicrobium aerolatum]MBP1805464.1 hypothetical protein [Rubellimicrobium aerolatum]
MIYPLAGLVLGALLGAMGARRRGGTRLDVLQWASVGLILGGLLGVFVLVIVSRSLAA